jgi:hypothetical protein
MDTSRIQVTRESHVPSCSVPTADVQRCERNMEQPNIHPTTVPGCQRIYELDEERALPPLFGAPILCDNFSDSPVLRVVSTCNINL